MLPGASHPGMPIVLVEVAWLSRYVMAAIGVHAFIDMKGIEGKL